MPHSRTQVESKKRFRIPMDPLSQATEEVRLTSLFLGIVRGQPPWGITVESSTGFHVYLMTRGTMCLKWIEGTEVQPIILQPGDVLALPRGLGYRTQDSLDTAADVDQYPRQILDKASEPHADDAEWIGMACVLDSAYRSLLTDFMPPVIHLPKGTPGLTRWLEPTITLFRAENEHASPWTRHHPGAPRRDRVRAGHSHLD